MTNALYVIFNHFFMLSIEEEISVSDENLIKCMDTLREVDRAGDQQQL
jgi:hypothetical protein